MRLRLRFKVGGSLKLAQERPLVGPTYLLSKTLCHFLAFGIFSGHCRVEIFYTLVASAETSNQIGERAVQALKQLTCAGSRVE